MSTTNNILNFSSLLSDPNRSAGLVWCVHWQLFPLVERLSPNQSFVDRGDRGNWVKILNPWSLPNKWHVFVGTGRSTVCDYTPAPPCCTCSACVLSMNKQFRNNFQVFCLWVWHTDNLHMERDETGGLSILLSVPHIGGMEIADNSTLGNRIMTPSAFSLVTYKLCWYRATVPPGTILAGKMKARFTAQRNRANHCATKTGKGQCFYFLSSYR